MTSYSEIFNIFLRNIEDEDLATISATDRDAMCLEYMETALGYMLIDDIKTSNSFEDRDDEMLEFNFDMPLREKVGLALYMVVAWYEPRINSLEHTLMFWGSKDEKWTNQKDHWKAACDVQKQYRLRARKHFRNYSSRNNSYLSGE